MIKLNRKDYDELFEKIVHIGKGFEIKLKEVFPIVHIYTKPGEIPKYKGFPVVDADEYVGSTPDIFETPKGMSKYNYLDRCRDIAQKQIIDKIKVDQGNNNTFILFLRPRIEATTITLNVKLEGKWVKEKNVKQIDGPEEIEDPFPCI